MIPKSYKIAGGIALTLGLLVYLNRDKIPEIFDLRTERLLLGLNPVFRAKVRKLLVKARKRGIELRIYSGNRGKEEQDKNYAQGRTTPGPIITYARFGESSHNWKKAVDLAEYKNGLFLWTNPNWERIGKMGESVGLTWGGRWKRLKDEPHFQSKTLKTA